MLDSVLRYFQERTTGAARSRTRWTSSSSTTSFTARLLVLRGTRAMQVGVGLGMVFVLYLVAQLLQLVTVLSVLGALDLQHHLGHGRGVPERHPPRPAARRQPSALERVSGAPSETKVIDEVVEAATELARHRIGAIITFEQDANLDEFVGVHKGHVIDAAVPASSWSRCSFRRA